MTAERVASERPSQRRDRLGARGPVIKNGGPAQRATHLFSNIFASRGFGAWILHGWGLALLAKDLPEQ